MAIWSTSLPMGGGKWLVVRATGRKKHCGGSWSITSVCLATKERNPQQASKAWAKLDGAPCCMGRPIVLREELYCHRVSIGKAIREADMAHAPKFLSLVNESKKKVKETNVGDVKRRMDAGEKFVLIDVREESEWARAHLPGASHLGRGIIERYIEQEITDAGTKKIVY